MNKDIIALNEYYNRNGATLIIQKFANNYIKKNNINLDEFLMLNSSLMLKLDESLINKYYKMILKSDNSILIYSFALKYGQYKQEMLKMLTEKIIKTNDLSYMFLYVTQIKNLNKEQIKKLAVKIIESKDPEIIVLLANYVLEKRRNIKLFNELIKIVNDLNCKELNKSLVKTIEEKVDVNNIYNQKESLINKQMIDFANGLE